MTYEGFACYCSESGEDLIAPHLHTRSKFRLVFAGHLIRVPARVWAWFPSRQEGSR